MSRSSDTGERALAGFPFVDTDDAVVAQERTSGLLIPHDLEVHRGLLPFRAVHRHAALSTISFHYLRYEPEVTMTCPLPRWFHLLLIPIFGLCRIGIERRRIEVAPGQCFVINPSARIRLHLIGNCEALFVKIPSTEFSSRLTNSYNVPVSSPVTFDSRRPVTSEACGALVDLLRWVCRDLEHVTPVSLVPITNGGVEDLILETILLACPHDIKVSMTRPKVGAVPQNVRRCEEFVEAYAGDPITIADMVAVSGASKRMLFQAFRNYRGTSPMAYLKSCRLERAHAELASVDKSECTVSQIASAWGFGHSGRFAQDYRAKFGCNPSDTLHGKTNPGYSGIPDTLGDD